MNVTVSTHAGYTARRKPPSEAGPYTEDRHARFEVGEYHFCCVFDGHGGDVEHNLSAVHPECGVAGRQQ